VNAVAREPYVNIRHEDLMGPCIGCTVIDVTQHDADEFAERGSFVALHFSNGMTARFPISDVGFNISIVGEDSGEDDRGADDDGGDNSGAIQT
jgi:hypothetical protein